jgi:hypothetical protein
MEFHMGILSSARSWRQPLRMIDSLLAVPATPTACGLAPSLHPFARAGWLGRSSAQRSASPAAGNTVRPRHLRLVRTNDPGSALRTDARLVISGSIGDVCAELDRLAEQELGEHTPT